jgi:decaprenyl-phosphate phosphoribosyltransferase
VRDYIRLMRLDHWFKNIFMLPGMFLAVHFDGFDVLRSHWLFAIEGVLATCLIASANYVINEWLDRSFDAFHPVKKNRPSVASSVEGPTVYALYTLLGATGLAIGYHISIPFVLTLAALLIMGIVYNVQPFRTKDRPYIDVLSESINNPIRLLLGWFALTSTPFPSSSIIVSYWMGGAYLMALKRYAEFRQIGDTVQASMYRKSFGYYTEKTLLASSVFYIILSSFFLGIFLIKHRIEYLLTFPFFSLVFVKYFLIAQKPNSIVQYPEKLYRERDFLMWSVGLTFMFAVLTVVDVPFLAVLRT